MRFFTNESKDDQDDPKNVDVQDREGHQPEGGYHPDSQADPDRTDADTVQSDTVQSDPVAVPQQRSSSPWSSTPDDTDRTDDDTVNGHDATDADTHTDTHTDTTDTATETGESNRVDEALDDRDRDRTDDTDVVEGHEDPTPPDHAVSDTTPEATTTTYGPDGVVTEHDDTVTDTDTDTLKDDGDFNDPQAVDPVTDETLDDTDKHDDVVAVADEDHEDEVTTPEEPAVVAAAIPAQTKPSETASAEVTSLFGDDAQSFQDRWRDVQLRFVDSPKEATAEAATLVDEAVDKLTAGLKAQKEQFTGDGSEDTEKLRVELRGYRDILNRIIAL